jgi:hypothetical protein
MIGSFHSEPTILRDKMRKILRGCSGKLIKNRNNQFKTSKNQFMDPMSMLQEINEK